MKTKEKAKLADVIVGANVRARRAAMGMSQVQMGIAIGVSFQQLQKYEKGSKRIAVSTLIAIAAALRCKPSELLGDLDVIALDETGGA